MTYRILNTKTRQIVAAGLSLLEAKNYIRIAGFHHIMIP